MFATRTIAGHEITLIEGRRYLAARKMVSGGVISKNTIRFDVTIRDITNGFAPHSSPILTGLSYEQANEFLRAFNDGKVSLEGRIW